MDGCGLCVAERAPEGMPGAPSQASLPQAWAQWADGGPEGGWREETKVSLLRLRTRGELGADRSITEFDYRLMSWVTGLQVGVSFSARTEGRWQGLFFARFTHILKLI